MTLVQETLDLPLILDADGIVRVSGTRVTLDTIIHAFHGGATAEEIAQQYPSVSLPDIYSIIGYYLKHSADANNYIQLRAKLAARVKRQNEFQFDPHGIRDRLLARKAG